MAGWQLNQLFFFFFFFAYIIYMYEYIHAIISEKL